jgi:hypothetical protein
MTKFNKFNNVLTMACFNLKNKRPNLMTISDDERIAIQPD